MNDDKVQDTLDDNSILPLLCLEEVVNDDMVQQDHLDDKSRERVVNLDEGSIIIEFNFNGLHQYSTLDRSICDSSFESQTPSTVYNETTDVDSDSERPLSMHSTISNIEFSTSEDGSQSDEYISA